MQQQRLLFPFTHGIDARAIDQVLLFARASQITVVAFTCISTSGKVRPEAFQEAKDFQEILRMKAQLYGVSAECYENTANCTVDCIAEFAQHAHCQGILLVSGKKGSHFVSEGEVRQLEEMSSVPFYKLHLLGKRKTMGAKSIFTQLVIESRAQKMPAFA